MGEFVYCDPFLKAGFDNETAQRLRDVQRHTGVPAQSVIAFYRRFGRIPDGKGASAIDPVKHSEELKKSAGCGEWVWTQRGTDDIDQYWVCSKCGSHTYFKTKYCGDCGRTMLNGGKDATD